MNMLPLLRLLLLATCTAFAVPAFAQNTPDVPSNQIARRVQEILSVPHGDADLFDSLHRIDAAYDKGDVDGADRELAHLVQVLVVEGTDPNCISRQLLPNVHVPTYASYTESHNPEFDASANRARLMRLMMQKALDLSARNDPQSKNYARAAIVFAAEEDFLFGSSFLLYVANAFDPIRRAAALSDVEAGELKRLLVEAVTMPPDFGDSQTAAFYARDKMLKYHKGDRVPPELIRSCLGFFQRAYELAESRLGSQYVLIQEVWTLRNIGVAIANDEIVSASDQLLSDWMKQSRLAVVNRWIEEAKSTAAAPPRFLTVQGLDKDARRVKRLDDLLKRGPTTRGVNGQ